MNLSLSRCFTLSILIIGTRLFRDGDPFHSISSRTCPLRLVLDRPFGVPSSPLLLRPPLPPHSLRSPPTCAPTSKGSLRSLTPRNCYSPPACYPCPMPPCVPAAAHRRKRSSCSCRSAHTFPLEFSTRSHLLRSVLPSSCRLSPAGAASSIPFENPTSGPRRCSCFHPVDPLAGPSRPLAQIFFLLPKSTCSSPSCTQRKSALVQLFRPALLPIPSVPFPYLSSLGALIGCSFLLPSSAVYLDPLS